MPLVRYIPSGTDYTPGELTSLQVAFDFLKQELGLSTEQERLRIARLVLAAYDQEGQTHRIISAVLRVCRTAEPEYAWETRVGGLAQTLNDMADEMEREDAQSPNWPSMAPAEPEGNASP